MKKIFLSLALALTVSVQAQTKDSIDTAQFAVVYDYTVDTQDDEGAPVRDSIQVAVQVGQRVTKSMPMSRYQAETENTREMPKDEWKNLIATGHQEALTHMPTVWINHPEGETTVRDVIFPHQFEGYESTPQWKWNLTTDTLRISGYLCQRAEATHRGVRWTAWYTEEVPSSVGPWRLRGLPGLIVKATADAHTFILAELRREATAITYTPSIKIERMKYNKLVKYRNEVFGSKFYPKYPMHHIAGLSSDFNDFRPYIEQLTVVTNDNGGGYILANNLPMLQKAHVYQPLEKK